MNTKTALVVDDSKSARFALRRFLESHQYRVETAEGAEQCFASLRTLRPDVVFLDHVMPGIDGFAALRQIKSDPATAALRVVICSSNEGAEFEAQARQCGAAGVLQKPPSAEQLARILDNLQKTVTAPVAAPPAPPPSKVANIREPEVAIEQRVMKVLRSSLAHPPPATPAVSALNEVASNLSAQIAQLQAQAAQLQTRIDEEQAQAQELASAQPDFSEIHAALATQLQRIEALEQLVDEHFHELHSALEAGLRSQIERIENVTAIACEAAREEAERAVMNAGARISDQLANSILTALRSVTLTPASPRSPEAASPPGTADRRKA